MLHAAAMLLGLCILWLLSTQRFTSAQDVALAALAASACVLAAARAGGVGSAFARAPRALLTIVSRAGAVLGGSVATMRAAVAADVTLKPALVRVRTRGRGAERAAFADMLSATPGMVVVETDPDGLLVHVMNEDSIDAADLGRLERITGAQADGGRR
jgi:multicomponent Na+:H+ antiporter subunit E